MSPNEIPSDGKVCTAVKPHFGVLIVVGQASGAVGSGTEHLRPFVAEIETEIALH
jgi:hypothetical protein